MLKSKLTIRYLPIAIGGGRLVPLQGVEDSREGGGGLTFRVSEMVFPAFGGRYDMQQKQGQKPKTIDAQVLSLALKQKIWSD